MEWLLFIPRIKDKTIKKRDKLIQAVEFGKADRVKQLLQKGYPVDTIDLSGRAVLEIACAHGHVDVAMVLIQHKANINVNNLAPLIAAIENEQDKIVKILLHYGAILHKKIRFCPISEDVYPIHFASAKGNVVILKMMLEKGCDVELITERGLRPIHVAAMYGRSEIITELCNNGADVNVTDINEYTPLHYAVVNKRHGAVEHLLSLYADVTHKDRFERTPLDLAIAQKLPNIVALINKTQNNEKFTQDMQTLASVQVDQSERLGRVEQSVGTLPSQIEQEVRRQMLLLRDQIIHQNYNPPRLSNCSSGCVSMDTLDEEGPEVGTLMAETSLSMQARMANSKSMGNLTLGSVPHRYTRSNSLSPYREPVNIFENNAPESPLKEDSRSQIVTKFPDLIRIMRPEDVIPRLYARRIIVEWQKDTLQEIKQDRDKNEFILRKVILKGTNREYNSFIHILQETSQGHLVNILKSAEPEPPRCVCLQLVPRPYSRTVSEGNLASGTLSSPPTDTNNAF